MRSAARKVDDGTRRLATAAVLDGDASALEKWNKIPRPERCAICLAMIPHWLTRLDDQRRIVNDCRAIGSLVPNPRGLGVDNVDDALQVLATRGSTEAAYGLEQLPDLLGEDDRVTDEAEPPTVTR
jgi:hypothetical protein